MRYNGDQKFPFELLCDVPEAIKKSIDAMKMKKIQANGSDISELDRISAMGNTLTQNSYMGEYNNFTSQLQKDKKKSNELLKFLECN